ncbi:hypothetical protein KY347_06045 [Candidatus Woesearchaeota archaeon]|nr:hypothetical protein [Candidatus Woesearchaeota archaeon]
MALETVAIIVIIALILFFLWAILRRVFRLLFYASLIIFLLLAANIFFVYRDAADLRENFDVSTKKVMLVDNNKVITGFLLDGDVNLLASEDLEKFSSYLESKDYEEILGDSYKLMVFDLGIISSLDEEIELDDEIITKEQAISALKSDADANEKAELFGDILTSSILSSRNPLFFFSEFKKGNIVIYPETALFKTVKFIPLSFVKDATKNIFEKTKETAKSFVVEEGE